MYQETHTNIFNHFNDIAWKKMLLAGKEEAKLAINNGQVDYLGRPKSLLMGPGVNDHTVLNIMLYLEL